MNELRKILVGLDLGLNGDQVTSGSRRAVDAALWLAKTTGARVLLLHSSAADEYYDAHSRGFVLVHDGASDKGLAALEAVAAEFRQEGLRTDLVIVDAGPGDAIVQRVLADSIDLVLVGKRTQVDTDARRLGSLSRRLVTECPSAVWVVKPDETPQPDRIVAAVEIDAVGRRVLEAAAFLARESGADLHVLHALQETLEVQMDPDRDDLDRDLVRKASLELHERLAEIDAEIESKAKFHLGFDSPSHAILGAEEKFDADLVILGTSSQKGVAGWLLGSTAARLLDRLDSSILAIKPA